MLAKKLADKIKNEVTIRDSASFNLNFKIEGEESEKFDHIAKFLKKSRTELAKFIILNSLDDLIEQLDNLSINNSNEPIELEELDEAIIKYTTPKIAKLDIGSTFELKELIGDDWDKFGEHGDKNRVGKKFKKLINTDHIKNVKFLYTKSNNHALYERV